MLHWSKGTAPAGDRVVAGTHADMGEITVRVEKIGDETRMGSIIQIIESEEGLESETMRTAFPTWRMGWPSLKSLRRPF